MQDAKNICSYRRVWFPALRRTATSATICHVTRTVTRTVLIVDDHPSFRASARAMLESEGFEVVGEASDGASALDAVEALEPDLVLLDVQLPDMSGFEVCAALEAHDGRPEVVLVSSRELDDFGELIDTSCACGFVPKGELSGELLAALLA
jgi:DNA-binding NarL/FixJ family response regulator